jgi:hypothetical protein
MLLLSDKLISRVSLISAAYCSMRRKLTSAACHKPIHSFADNVCHVLGAVNAVGVTAAGAAVAMCCTSVRTAAP